jgi:phosphinothricin tripeptide acetyl hydrolase
VTGPSAEAIKLRAYIAKNAALDVPLAEQRKLADSFADRVPLPAGVTAEPTTIAGRNGEWLVPEGAHADRAILYFHGGGFVLGSIRSHRHLAAHVAAATAVPSLIFDYRLAPEHPFPAAFEDGLSAYRDLLAEFGSGRKIALVGDSAGGNLALGIAMASAEDSSVPAAVACMSPAVDLQACLDAPGRLTSDDPALSPEMMRDWIALYLAGQEARDWRASPIEGDLARLPPTLIQAAAGELLSEQIRRFSTAAVAAGSPVAVELWPDLMHDWHWFAPKLPEANEAIGRLADFLKRHLA